MRNVIVTFTLALLAGTAQAAPPEAGDPVAGRERTVVGAAPAPGYAEGLYAGYTTGSGNVVLFDVTTVSAGRLVDLAGTPFGDVIAPPGYVIEDRQVGTRFEKARFAESVAQEMVDAMSPSDLAATADGFEEAGFPLALGRYRKLHVIVSIGSDVRQHQALELCWRSQGHCAVLDPAIPFLQSKIETQQKLEAERWGPRLFVVERNEPASSGPRALAVCGLASNPGVKDRYYYWPAWSIQYKNIFGMTLVQKNMGAQKTGIRCDAGCRPAPYGYSNASSCWGTLGWSCAPNNAFGFGTSGGSGKWIAETKATHKWMGSAAADVTVLNQGSINVNLQWSVDGGVDGNGGQMMDTCGWF